MTTRPMPESGRLHSAAPGREPVLTSGRLLANQSRWDSLRAGNNIGAHIGTSQQLMDTFDRPSGAALAKGMSALARQSN